MENNTSKNRAIYSKIVQDVNKAQNELQRLQGRKDAILAELSAHGIQTKAQLDIRLHKLTERIQNNQSLFDTLVARFKELFHDKL